MKRYWPLLILALLPLIPLWRAVFLGETIGAFDEIRPMAPWNGQPTNQPWDVLQADSVIQFYAWRDLVLESWGKGQLPLWNPYQLAGTPLLANSQSGGVYPPHILLGVLHVPTGIALTLLAWFHLFIAGWGTFRLARRLGASEVGAVVAGASFSLSQFMLAWTALPSVISTCAWIPWVLLGVEDLFDTKKHPVNPGLAAPLALMFMAGHLQFAAYGVLAALFLGLWRLIVFGKSQDGHSDAGGIESGLNANGHGGNPGEQGVVRSLLRRDDEAGLYTPVRRINILTLGLAAALASVLLALPHLVAVLGYSGFSHRQGTTTSEGYQAYVAGGIPAYSLVGLTNPALQGLPTQASPVVEGASNYWPGIVSRGMNFAETALGLSPFVVFLLIFAGFGVRRLRHLGPYAALTLIALLLALGTPLNRLPYFGLPGWSATGSPGRVAVLFVLGCCLIAGCALTSDVVSKRTASLSTAVFILVGITPFLLIRSLADSLISWLPQVGPDTVARLIAGAAALATGPYFVAILLCSIVAILLTREHKFKPALIVAVGCLLPISLYATQVLRTSASTLPKVVGPAESERIAAINDSWDLLAAAPATLPPNTATLSRIHDLSGYDSLLHRDTVKLLHEIMGQDPAPPANGNMMFIKPSANPLLLAEAGVSEVWTRKPMEKLGVLPVEEDGLFKYRLPGPGRAFVERPDGTKVPAKISDEGLGSFKVECEGPGKLVVRDRAMPGWQVSTGGRTYEIPTGTWMEVPGVPDGPMSAQFSYRPSGVVPAFWISVFAWLALGALVLRFRKP